MSIDPLEKIHVFSGRWKNEDSIRSHFSLVADGDQQRAGPRFICATSFSRAGGRSAASFQLSTGPGGDDCSINHDKVHYCRRRIRNRFRPRLRQN
jgi:hypothetical protein